MFDSALLAFLIQGNLLQKDVLFLKECGCAAGKSKKQTKLAFVEKYNPVILQLS